MKYKAVRGMEDILPKDAGTWQWLEHQARREFDFYGYEEIRTPILEDTSIFVRSIGETTDIVTKEMYTFKDRKERSLTLRPEGTAPIVRSYIEHSLDKASPVLKLWYIGPMFRSERPQKGRSRQFHQIGAEVIGSRSIYNDAEVIMQIESLLKCFNLEGFEIKLNTLGCKADKEKFAGTLKKYLEGEKKRLCDDCKERLKKNVLRTLDCKKESCIQAMRLAPGIQDNLCTPCSDEFNKLKNILTKMKINFKETKNLVRGLDYYTGTVFEITHPALGGQDAIGAGGRYDNLVKDFGGPDTGAIGYALGVERIILALKEGGALPKPKTIFIAALGEEAALKAMLTAEHIRTGLGRKEGRKIKVITGCHTSSLKSQMRSADKNGARFVLILGENELKTGKIVIKDMFLGKQDQDQHMVDINNIIAELGRRMAS